MRDDIFRGRRTDSPGPLGAHWDGNETSFTVFSGVADRIELCLIDDDGTESRTDLVETSGRWHTTLPGVAPGRRYGYRVHGHHDPAAGRFADPAKLLVDPYARAITGELVWCDALTGRGVDSAGTVPLSVVADARFDWGADHRAPGTPWSDTLIYEVNVKALTATHPGVDKAARGTYAGLASEASIERLQRLGVTAVQLLPVHQHVSESHLVRSGLTNLWGYNTLGFFAPHGAYSSAGTRGEQVGEFQAMVRSLHAAGIEVILDVVYNHTAEAGSTGPLLSLRGLDNHAYYRLDADDPAIQLDVTGCGNSLNTDHPMALQLVTDSLRYWVTEMGVDGFRFDLAVALTRDRGAVDFRSGLLKAIHQDPVLSAVKLIAEPWDLGNDGYQVGGFPPGWVELNGKYRDTVRDFWRGQDSMVGGLASRLTGSADIYQPGGRLSNASVNFVTSHDGFTLADLVSHNHKHNKGNGEDNRDGDDHNRSWNCGVEGATDDAGVLALRARQQRNFLATVLLSHGVPFLLGGDEMSRTQRGNNNGYCQDNDISWFDWDKVDIGIGAFVSALTELRRQHSVFRRERWSTGRIDPRTARRDVAWFTADGVEHGDDEWAEGASRSIGMFLDGGDDDDCFYLALNAHDRRLDLQLPTGPYDMTWVKALDTTDPVPAPVTSRLRTRSGGERVRLTAHSLALFQEWRG